MQTQLQAIWSDGSKGMSSSKVTTVTDELQQLMDFNATIGQDYGASVANLTLAIQDSYLSHLKTGIKSDMLAALRTAPLQMATLFPDSVINWAEEDIANYEFKRHSLQVISFAAHQGSLPPL